MKAWERRLVVIMVILASINVSPGAHASSVSYGANPDSTGYVVGDGYQGEVVWQGLLFQEYALDGSQVFAPSVQVEVNDYTPYPGKVNMSVHQFETVDVPGQVRGPNGTIVNVTVVEDVHNSWTYQEIPLLGDNQSTLTIPFNNTGSWVDVTITINGTAWTLQQETPPTDLPSGASNTGDVLILVAVMVAATAIGSLGVDELAKRSQARHANVAPPFPYGKVIAGTVAGILLLVLWQWELLDQVLGGWTYAAFPLAAILPAYYNGLSRHSVGDMLLILHLRLRDGDQKPNIDVYSRVATRNAAGEEFLHDYTWHDTFFFAIGAPTLLKMREPAEPGELRPAEPYFVRANPEPSMDFQAAVLEGFRDYMIGRGMAKEVAKDLSEVFGKRLTELAFQSRSAVDFSDYKFVLWLDSDENPREERSHFARERVVIEEQTFTVPNANGSIRTETREVRRVERTWLPHVVQGEAWLPAAGWHWVPANVANTRPAASQAATLMVEKLSVELSRVLRDIDRTVEDVQLRRNRAEREHADEKHVPLTRKRAEEKLAALAPTGLSRAILEAGRSDTGAAPGMTQQGGTSWWSKRKKESKPKTPAS